LLACACYLFCLEYDACLLACSYIDQVVLIRDYASFSSYPSLRLYSIPISLRLPRLVPAGPYQLCCVHITPREATTS
jgi:hypothetical protein